MISLEVQLLVFNAIKSYINANMNPEAKIALSNDMIYVLAHNGSYLVSVQIAPTGVRAGWLSTELVNCSKAKQPLIARDFYDVYWSVMEVVDRLRFEIKNAKCSKEESDMLQFEKYLEMIGISKKDGLRFYGMDLDEGSVLIPYFRGYYTLNKSDKVGMRFHIIENNIVIIETSIRKKNSTHVITSKHRSLV